MFEDLKELKKNWDEFARKDPLWAILPIPGKKGNRWDVKELFETGKAEIKEVMDYVGKLGITLNHKRALDFGCGVGRLSQALCGYFNECVGVDISSEMIQLAIKYNQHGDHCRYIVNERADLKTFAADHFDFIYSNIVFQHMHPDLTIKYIGEFVRIVRPGGIVVFQVATGLQNVHTKFSRFLNRLIPRRLRRIYKNIKYGTWAIKDMYCIDERILNEYIRSCGGQLIDVGEDSSSLPRYYGRRYCVSKKPVQA